MHAFNATEACTQDSKFYVMCIITFLRKKKKAGLENNNKPILAHLVKVDPSGHFPAEACLG